MQKYFYSDGVNQLGPFTLQELLEKNITEDTLVWYAPMPEWIPARELPELAHLFEGDQPPRFKEPHNTHDDQPQRPSGGGGGHQRPRGNPPKTYLLESILATLFCCLPLGIVGIVYASKVEGRFRRGDQEGAEEASRQAKQWVTISFALGIVALVIRLILMAANG